MEYSDGYLREQLPPEDPPATYVPGDVAREIESWIRRGKFEDPSLLARSVRWTYAIFSELGLGNFQWLDGAGWRMAPWGIPPSPPGPQTAVGLYDNQREEPGFGLSLNVPVWAGPPFFILGQVEFPRLKRRFPIAIRQVTTELHAAPNPVNATTTCWARCNSTSSWGIITAGHAIGTSLPGLSVPLDNGTTGTTHRCFWQPIDAAFVLTSPPAAHTSPLPVVIFPAAGLPVTVECKSGPQQRTVSSACNSQGFYQTRVFPVLFFIDRPCSPGDSGALIRLSTGEAGGIYNGAQASPATGGSSGLALNFAQAMFALHTTAYL